MKPLKFHKKRTPSLIYSLENQKLKKHKNTFIAPTAALIGSVILHENSSVWFNVVIRADNAPIEIGEGSNVQDGSILHVDEGYPITIGKNVTVGHKVMLHGCNIGDGSLIGMNAVVLNGAKIGKHCLIGANALVTEDMQVADGSMVLGSPGKVVKMLSDEAQVGLLEGAKHYIGKIKLYNTQLKPLS